MKNFKISNVHILFPTPSLSKIFHYVTNSPGRTWRPTRSVPTSASPPSAITPGIGGQQADNRRDALRQLSSLASPPRNDVAIEVENEECPDGVVRIQTGDTEVVYNVPSRTVSAKRPERPGDGAEKVTADKRAADRAAQRAAERAVERAAERAADQTETEGATARNASPAPTRVVTAEMSIGRAAMLKEISDTIPKEPSIMATPLPTPQLNIQPPNTSTDTIPTVPPSYDRPPTSSPIPTPIGRRRKLEG